MTSDNPARALVQPPALCGRALAGLASAIVLGLTSACAAPAPATAPATTPASVAAPSALWQQVVDEVADARCTADADCHSLPVGHKPCGGPASFLAWSAQASREAVLRQRAEAYTQAQQAAAAASGRVSTCSVLSDPGAHCDAASQRCVLNTAAPMRPAAVR
jgi:hypothetical protein